MDNSIRSTDGPDTIGPDQHPRKTFRQRLHRVRNGLTTREGLIGNYDYAFFFRPNLPFMAKTGASAPFFGLNDPMPTLLALLLGLQHALAMLGGIVTPPIIIAGAINLSAEHTQYLVSTTLIVCGLLSLIQITRFHIYKTPYYIGSGILSLAGVSFTIITVSMSAFSQMYKNGFCPSAEDGTPLACPDAYGALIGTSACCALILVLISFMPAKMIQKVFPPIVTGPTVMLIGISLIQSGFNGWLGGSGSCMSRPESGPYMLCPSVDAPHALPWGSPEFVGLGFSVFVTILICERVGSPIMKSSSVVIGLLVGCIIAAACGYFDRSGIDAAPVASFIWVHTFKLQVYGPLVLPILAVYIITACEAVGDITATCDVSQLEVQGETYDSRIQGGVLADGFNSVLAALMTVTPMTTFAQNNGVIALTRCANRKAGFFLLVAGIFAKFAAAIVAIPASVLGGMTTFLFGSVAVSGLAIVAKVPMNRRNRFILTASLALGYGAILTPTWFSYVFGETDNKSLQGFLEAIVLVLETGFAVTAFNLDSCCSLKSGAMAETKETDAGSLLRAPSDTIPESIERLPCDYKPLYTFDLEKDKQYRQQYGDMYFLRLAKLKPAAEKVAAQAWSGFEIGGEEATKVERVLDVRQGELCWVTGTIYMDMALKPNILDDISKDHWVSAVPPRQKYKSSDGSDSTMLEDESGRVRLIGARLADEMMVTGCIVSVMGTENANGDFEVIDIRTPDLAPQPARWEYSDSSKRAAESGRKVKKQKIEDEDEEMTESRPGSGGKIAIISGLDISGSNTGHTLQINLLLEYLLGEALDPASQQQASQISRLIIAGNSIVVDDSTPGGSLGNTRKTAHKKYGYDSSAYNPAPTAHLDDFLAALLPSIPVTLLPGASDPANASLPQQPVHSAMFPQARAYGSGPSTDGEKKIGWFDAVTNPWEGEVEGWRVLGTGGQNVDDVFKYVEGDDRLGMMEAMCRWRCCAPTAPDTLWSYPFQDDDPFVIKDCPHLYIVGSQPKFDTTVIEGPDGQMVRLITVPRFSETGELLLVDSETLEVERVVIDVFNGDS
ncbi:hypothetical protein VE03_00128 [Pseudogymnoascus sp. 23342-1-I1]|nr:hypothetical protein VE03_00128 [Pseudogymnoascus sp. 23342-1-I1]